MWVITDVSGGSVFLRVSAQNSDSLCLNLTRDAFHVEAKRLNTQVFLNELFRAWRGKRQ